MYIYKNIETNQDDIEIAKLIHSVWHIQEDENKDAISEV